LPGQVRLQGSRDIPPLAPSTTRLPPPASISCPPPIPTPPRSTPSRDSTNGSLEHYLDASGTTAFLVIHDDELLYEKYFDGYDKNSIQTSFWIAKLFASALVGIAIDEGHIKSVDEPITNYIFELREKDKRFGSITIRNFLTMSSGRTGCVA